jgi:hypothetical protein
MVSKETRAAAAAGSGLFGTRISKLLSRADSSTIELPGSEDPDGDISHSFVPPANYRKALSPDVNVEHKRSLKKSLK